jgi:biotin/lipoyl-binding protein
LRSDFDRLESLTGVVAGPVPATKEGDVVKECDPLYRIEQGLFQAAVEQAQGALERSKAAKFLPRYSWSWTAPSSS